MFAGNEWILIVGVLAVVVVVVLVVVVASRGRFGSDPPVGAALVRGSTDAVLGDLLLALSGRRRWQLGRSGANSLVLEWSYIPGWAIVVAVLFFPLGLVALLARRSESGTVVASQQHGDTVELRMAGVFDRSAIASINSVIEARS